MNEECPARQICSHDGECIDRMMLTEPVSVDTGGPVIADEPFPLEIGLPFHRNEIKPKTIDVRCEECQLEIPTVASQIGMVEYDIPGMPTATFPVLGSNSDSNFFFADLDGDEAFSAGDVPVRVERGSVHVKVTIPDKETYLQEFDGEVRLALDPVVKIPQPDEEGTPEVKVAIVSADPDTAGASDAAGIPPRIVVESFPIEVRPGIEDLCPCEGPVSGGTWKNHGAYVSCVSREAKELVKGDSAISPVASGPLWLQRARARLREFQEWRRLVRAAARSNCGKRPRRWRLR